MHKPLAVAVVAVVEVEVVLAVQEAVAAAVRVLARRAARGRLEPMAGAAEQVQPVLPGEAERRELRPAGIAQAQLAEAAQAQVAEVRELRTVQMAAVIQRTVPDPPKGTLIAGEAEVQPRR